jgi:hypothetical protein
MEKRTTQWGEVQFKLAPDGTERIALVLDGHEYTTDVVLNQVTAYRLGVALVRLVRQMGLPDAVVDREV